MLAGGLPLHYLWSYRGECKGSTRQGSTRQGSTRQRNTSHPSFVEAAVGSTRKGSAPTHHFVDLQQGVHARGVFVGGLLPTPSNFGATVVSTCKGNTRKRSTPPGRAAGIPLPPKMSSKIDLSGEHSPCAYSLRPNLEGVRSTRRVRAKGVLAREILPPIILWSYHAGLANLMGL